MDIFRWILEVMGLALLGFLAVGSMKKVNYALIYAAVVVLLIGEGMSCYAFYIMGA